MLTINAQNSYENLMQNAQQKLFHNHTEEEYNKSSEQFEKIATSEKNKWLPYYYAGLSKSLAALTIKTKSADALCNDADRLIKKADSLSPNNSEILILKSLNLSARLNVNPKARAIKYNKQINQTNELALKLDSNNPRAHLQKAQALYYTPEAFGGGSKKALPLFQVALEKFNTTKNNVPLMPSWGKDIAEKMISECKAQPKKQKH